MMQRQIVVHLLVTVHKRPIVTRIQTSITLKILEILVHCQKVPHVA